MGLGHFADQAVGSQQTQLTCDGGGLAAVGLKVLRLVAKEQRTQVTVAEAIDRELAAIDGSQKFGVAASKGVQGPDSSLLPASRLAELAGQFAQGRSVGHAGHRVEIPVVGCLGYLGSSMDISDAFTHLTPGLGSIGGPFGGAIGLDVPWIIDRRFDTKDRALLVVHLDRVAIDVVLDAYAFGTVFDVAGDLAGEEPVGVAVGGDLAAEKTQHVGARQGRDAVVHQLRVELSQRVLIAEQHVGGPFALIEGPVVSQERITEQILVSRMCKGQQIVQQTNPILMKMLVQQTLSGRDILDIDEAIVAFDIADAVVVHLPGQPVPAVNAGVDSKGQPRLNPHVHEAEDRMDVIAVVVLTLAAESRQVDVLGLTVGPDFVCPTWLDTSQDANQPLDDAVLLSDPACDGLLGFAAAGEILVGTVPPTRPWP